MLTTNQAIKKNCTHYAYLLLLGYIVLTLSCVASAVWFTCLLLGLLCERREWREWARYTRRCYCW